VGQNLVKYFSLPLLILVAVFLTTFNELRFQTGGGVPLNAKAADSFKDVSFDQAYEIEKDMRFKVEIENRQLNKKATLLWPGEPFAAVFVLVPAQGEEWSGRTRFQGRLVRCLYQCAPSGMLIVMDDFTKLLVNKFNLDPEDAGKLPRLVLDTSQVPGGWSGYARIYKARLMILAGSWLMGLALFAKHARQVRR
jgi:hypothetical protein